VLGPELYNSTHSPLVQSAGPTASVSEPNALTNTSEIQMSPIQAEDLLEVPDGFVESENSFESSTGAKYEQSMSVIKIIGYFLVFIIFISS
jgi:hypothetical protein